jgi:hypothetical protein
MRNDGEIQFHLDRFHVFNVSNEFPVVLVPVIFEEYQGKELILGGDLLRIFGGIWTDSYCLYNR